MTLEHWMWMWSILTSLVQEARQQCREGGTECCSLLILPDWFFSSFMFFQCINSFFGWEGTWRALPEPCKITSTWYQKKDLNMSRNLEKHLLQPINSHHMNTLKKSFKRHKGKGKYSIPTCVYLMIRVSCALINTLLEKGCLRHTLMIHFLVCSDQLRVAHSFHHCQTAIVSLMGIIPKTTKLQHDWINMIQTVKLTITNPHCICWLRTQQNNEWRDSYLTEYVILAEMVAWRIGCEHPTEWGKRTPGSSPTLWTFLFLKQATNIPAISQGPMRMAEVLQDTPVMILYLPVLRLSSFCVTLCFVNYVFFLYI